MLLSLHVLVLEVNSEFMLKHLNAFSPEKQLMFLPKWIKSVPTSNAVRELFGFSSLLRSKQTGEFFGFGEL